MYVVRRKTLRFGFGFSGSLDVGVADLLYIVAVCTAICGIAGVAVRRI